MTCYSKWSWICGQYGQETYMGILWQVKGELLLGLSFVLVVFVGFFVLLCFVCLWGGCFGFFCLVCFGFVWGYLIWGYLEGWELEEGGSCSGFGWFGVLSLWIFGFICFQLGQTCSTWTMPYVLGAFRFWVRPRVILIFKDMHNIPKTKIFTLNRSSKQKAVLKTELISS